ncbi:Nucleoside-diphosphate-sugar epimerase [Paenibacillus sp. yr247]|uniref:NAD-dependent epimerase/dehydratase family protein n=1 Tax=Paenibacillus sp. yr247 TaxID=1761880 RepID=UPI00088F454F|nr:NAD(P)-dependent oxidoreductase [Paenibacillus sp. yr247]SDN94770.1 Nucleoside-diphosphate-sugar epimerase [Paenibacillus sp. yr247]
MKILITGAAGSVGSGVAEVLVPHNQIHLSDVVQVETSHPFYQVDVRESGSLDEAANGVDVIIHTPAYHGIHMGKHSEQEFYDLNITGMFNMFQSAVRNKVRRVVWLSSMSVYGTDFYAYTKKIGEQLCQFYHERHGIEVIMLRPADFTPYRDALHYGERLLHGGVDRRDVIQAVVLATECRQKYGAYHIVRQDPFSEVDVKAYSESPIDIWEKTYTGAKQIIEKHQFKLPSQIHVTDLFREQNELGYKPKYNFGTFIEEFTRVG